VYRLTLALVLPISYRRSTNKDESYPKMSHISHLVVTEFKPPWAMEATPPNMTVVPKFE
jgi:hypothetical protein